MQTVIEALTLGIRDYIEKTKSKGVILGLSGGIDSAVTCALAVRALGPERVIGVRMPSGFSSNHSLEDAEVLASNLGIALRTVPIESMVEACRQTLALKKPLSDQNVQARIRGLVLMAISNETDYLVLGTTNKSEMAVGYGTMYGDLIGALMPIGDLYKTQVWALAKAINAELAVIPDSSIMKTPSAELAPGQIDQDTLPPYETLDAVLEAYLERDLSLQQIVLETAIPEKQVQEIIKKVDSSEYKRKQAPPILMVSKKVFGEARRCPVVFARS
ncbi:MAG: NAD(+) synthase [Myxococcota bacterium]